MVEWWWSERLELPQKGGGFISSILLFATMIIIMVSVVDF